MDTSAFYGVVSAINFTLLGLWWVAVKDRAEKSGETESSRLTAYLVSLQFVILGTASLLAQVAPEVIYIWRVAFGVAGLVGAVGVIMLSREIRRTLDVRIAPTLFRWLGVPLYVAVVLVALVPPSWAATMPENFKLIQLEALLVSLLVFLGVQEAWVVSMGPAKPKRAAPASADRGSDFPDDGRGPLPHDG